MAQLNFSVPFDPYKDLPESEVTSNPIDLRDAFDFTLSTRTSAGTTIDYTYQVSNSTARTGIELPPEETYSDWTTVSSSTATVLSPILGVRYARILRGSNSSMIFEAAKYVR